MNEEQRYDTLSMSIDEIVGRGEFAPTGDADVDVLARLASGLRGLPAQQFKARLRDELVSSEEGRGLLSGPVGRLRAAVSLDRGTGLAAAGGGCGLVAGACCVGGAVVNVLGFASAAAVATFIETSIPYFVGVSIIMMAALLFWVFRHEGFQRTTLARSAMRVGVVVGSAYGVVFAATMALSMAMGLY